MDRDMVAARRKEIQETIAELAAELEDLAAFERVLDRQEGKKVSTYRFKIIKGKEDSSCRFMVHMEDARGENFHVPKGLRMIGMGAGTSWAIPNLLRRYDSGSCILCDGDRVEPHNIAREQYDVSLPEKKQTLPDLIIAAMWMLVMQQEVKVTPKRVEEIIEQHLEPGPMSQNVNSVMWRMVKQGTLEKDPDGPNYWLPKMNKAADEMSSRDPPAALESNQAKGQGPVTGVEHDGNLAH